MSVIEIANQLVAFCKEGKNVEAINTLYADDVESIEAADPPEGERTTKGIEAVRGKNQWWNENHEIHESSVKGPWPHGDDRFAIHFFFDVTNKPSSQRYKMEEIGVYTVANGKVIREEFFYSMGG